MDAWTAFGGVIRADEAKTGGRTQAESFALDAHFAFVHSGDEEIDGGVGHQIEAVYRDNAGVGAGECAATGDQLSTAQGGGQIKAAEQAFHVGAGWHFHKGDAVIAQQCAQSARQARLPCAC